MVLLLLGPLVSSVHAQTQIVTATPGYINLGMTTSISVVAPAGGTYSVVVKAPNGATSQLPYTFAFGGQSQNETFGNATIGFQSVVNQVGTYNVFVEQGTTVVGSTSFYVTNQLLINVQMVTGGTCDYVSGVTRGMRVFAHVYVTYASNGAAWTNASKGWTINGTVPSGQIVPLTWDSHALAMELGVLPNWNYTNVGNWSPSINASDAAGNKGSYKDTGAPYTITPATLSESIALVNTTSSNPVTNLLNGQSITIKATINYPTNAEPVTGFVAPLAPARGGSVSAQVGWGYYNTTSGTFGGKTKTGTVLAGALLGTVPMTYTGANGTYSGQFVSSSLPTLPAGTAFEVVVSSSDSASPANTGFSEVSIAPGIGARTVTSTAVSTSTLPGPSTTITQTASTTTVTQTIPTVVYASLAILLVLGVIIGYIVRVPRR